MGTEKIASKLILADGSTYTIGVRGNKEQVALKVTADTEVNWALYNISVQDLSDGGEQIVSLSADGECTFEIPLGNKYSITLPFIDGYTQPNDIIYTASVSSRNIEYNYNNLNEYLTIRIAVRSEADDASMFNGLEVTCVGNRGVDYTGTIENGQVTILIPYGTGYSITMPEFDGLAHNHIGEYYTAGIPARNLVFSYVDYNNLHVYGLDAEGNAYTIADLQEMGADAAAALIVAGAYNDATLANAPRKDGGIGCGFCWSIASPTIKNAWATANVDFGANNTVVAEAIANGVLSEGCGYYTNHDLAFAVKDGSGESALVRQVGAVLADAGSLNQASPTPAFDSAAALTSPVSNNGNGFVLSFGQMYALYQSKTEMDLLYAALGKTAPTIHSGGWWTSCQTSATRAVYLNNGSFNNYSKTTSLSVLVAFDL